MLRYPDFPILLETWRTCLQDEFDLESLRQLLDEIRTGRIKLTETTTTVGIPFADGLIWKQTNTYMYEDDSPPSGKASQLSGELLKEVLFLHFSAAPHPPRPCGESGSQAAADSPRICPPIGGRSPGLDKGTGPHTRPRVGRASRPPWSAIMSPADSRSDRRIREKSSRSRLPGASVRMVCALEISGPHGTGLFNPPAICSMLRDAVTDEPVGAGALRPGKNCGSRRERPDRRGGGRARALSDVFLQWLSFYGPVPRSYASEALGLDGAVLDDLLAGLVETGGPHPRSPHGIGSGAGGLRPGEPGDPPADGEEVAADPLSRPCASTVFPCFSRPGRGLVKPGEDADDLQDRLDQLFGFPAPADAWEKQILPARMSPYYGAWLDSLMQGNGLMWFGCGKRKLAFAFADDLELFLASAGQCACGNGGGRCLAR